MIADSLENALLYAPLLPRLQQVMEAVRSVDPATAEPAVFSIDGKDLILMINRPAMKRPENARLEVHDRMIDMHIPLSGSEGFAWKPRAALLNPAEPYNTDKDARHYLDVPDTRFTLIPGQFALFFPGDAHAGCIGEGELLKIVIKIRVRESV